MNPHYDSDKLGWEVITFDQPDMSYEFNTLCFWKTKEGLVFSAQSSGCSCPTPFEEYEGKTAVDIEQKLERVGSYEQAVRIIDGWNEDYNKRPYLSESQMDTDKRQLRSWFNGA